MNGIIVFVVFVISIPLHELGHALIAWHENIFGRFGFSFLGFCVKLTEPFKHRLDYLSGFLMSLLILPLWYYSEFEVTWFILTMAGISVLDFLVVIFYGKLRSTKVRHIIEYQEAYYAKYKPA